MALFHHDARDYDQAASDAAKKARQKLEEQIERGRKSAGFVVDKITREVPIDKVARVGAIQFDVKPIVDGVADKEDANAQLVIATGGDWELLHRNALGQIAERADIPMAYVNDLAAKGKWGKELLAENLRALFAHRGKEEKYLLRSVDHELRGFLSNKYRRLDTRQLLETAVQAFQKIGAVPVDGVGTDTRVRIRALLPFVFEPVPNEIVAYGMDWGNSDYGNGAHVLSMFMLRLWCTNFATMESVLREVHLGTRLSEDVAWSDRTFKLDTERSVSMLEDAVGHTLSPAKVNDMNALVARADAEKVTPTAVNDWLKKNLTKGMAEKVKETFSGADVENLPPGNSKWRLSNALSWVAGTLEDKEQALDLQRLAGKVLEPLATKAA